MVARSRVVWPLIAGLLLVLAAAPPARAGYVIVDDKDNRTLISRDRIKIVPKQTHTVFVLDVGLGRLWLANPGARRVWEGTVDQYCEGMRATLGAAATERQAAENMKALERQLEKLNPVQREQVRQLVERFNAQVRRPTAAKRAVLVQSTIDVATVAGLLARRYQVFAAGKVYADVWLTPDPNVAGDLNVERVADTFGKMGGCVAGAAQQSDDIVEASPEYSRLYRLGWPLKVVVYEDAQGKPVEGETRMLVTTMQRVDLAESEFALPEGYQRAPLDEVLGTASAK